MHLWRISGHADLTGFGAELAPGRWHTATPGKRAVYLAEHPAVAVFENLVNLFGVPRFIPDHFQLLKIYVPDGLITADLSPGELAALNPDNAEASRIIGDAWLTSMASPLLRIPSVPSPESWNYLMNPLHPRAMEIKIGWTKAVAYDKRLYRVFTTHA